MPTAAIVSFRLGGTDGVAVVAASWGRALATLGFDVVTVAGEGTADRLVPGLGIGVPPDPGDLDGAVAAALADADLTVVENLCTIPLNVAAARSVAATLRGRPAILHHHDPAWQRADLARLARLAPGTDLPPDDPAWHHVTVNRLTARQLAVRGIAATTIYNGFDVDAAPGDRPGTRTGLGIGATERLFLHPVRAIARKDIPAALSLTEALGATYWLSGPAEDGYGEALAKLLANADCRVIHQPAPGLPDAYAAADAVLFPSRWEGFGNPPVEAAIHRRPAAVGHYPVADELAAFGFTWFPSDDLVPLGRFLDRPDEELLDRNQAVARAHFSQERVTADLARLLDDAGWRP